MADEATEWAEKELDRFKDFLAEAVNQDSGQHAAVLQEGGELIDHPLRKWIRMHGQDSRRSFWMLKVEIHLPF